MSQTTMTDKPGVAYPGQLGDGSLVREIVSRIAQGAVVAGRPLYRGTDAEDQAKEPSVPVLNDADAIITAKATAASEQVTSGAGLNGVVGAGRMYPASKITFTGNAHADWDATTAILEGEDRDGNYQRETFAIPADTGFALTSTKYYSKVTKLTVPAQTGTNGSYTLGIGTDMDMLTGRDVVGVGIYDAMKVPGSYADKEPLPVCRKGRVWVTAEEAVSVGDPVYIRLIATGGEVVGAFRRSPDGTPGSAPDAVPLEGARWVTAASAAAVGLIELQLV
ncbi:MAG: hypothetical protein L6Q76_00045 [Polyangiaceae bacterium]|nr:hypothetical protein [Polyangiaceae bacterium]